MGQELEDLLPARPEFPNVIGDAEEVDLQEFDTTRGSGGGQRREAYNDSSDEESSHHGPGGTVCPPVNICLKSCTRIFFQILPDLFSTIQLDCISNPDEPMDIYCCMCNF